jgi:hypothetical protein
MVAGYRVNEKSRTGATSHGSASPVAGQDRSLGRRRAVARRRVEALSRLARLRGEVRGRSRDRESARRRPRQRRFGDRIARADVAGLDDREVPRETRSRHPSHRDRSAGSRPACCRSSLRRACSCSIPSLGRVRAGRRWRSSTRRARSACSSNSSSTRRARVIDGDTSGHRFASHVLVGGPRRDGVPVGVFRADDAARGLERATAGDAHRRSDPRRHAVRAVDRTLELSRLAGRLGAVAVRRAREGSCALRAVDGRLRIAVGVARALHRRDRIRSGARRRRQRRIDLDPNSVRARRFRHPESVRGVHGTQREHLVDEGPVLLRAHGNDRVPAAARVALGLVAQCGRTAACPGRRIGRVRARPLRRRRGRRVGCGGGRVLVPRTACAITSSNENRPAVRERNRGAGAGTRRPGVDRVAAFVHTCVIARSSWSALRRSGRR